MFSGVSSNKHYLDFGDDNPRPTERQKVEQETEDLQIGLGAELPKDAIITLFSYLNLKEQVHLSCANQKLNSQYWRYVQPYIIKRYFENTRRYNIKSLDGFIKSLDMFKRSTINKKLVVYSTRQLFDLTIAKQPFYREKNDKNILVKYVNAIKNIQSFHGQIEELKFPCSSDQYRLLRNFKDNPIKTLYYSQRLDKDKYDFAGGWDPDTIGDRDFLQLKKNVKEPAALPPSLYLTSPDTVTSLSLPDNHLNNRDIRALAGLINLTYLNVRRNILSRAGVQAIGELFLKLKYLDISNQLDEYDDLTIQGADLPLLNPLKDLEELNIGGLRIEVGSKAALSGLSAKLKSITMRYFVFEEIEAFEDFPLEHVTIDDVSWDEEFRRISVLKSTLRSFTFTKIDFDAVGDPTIILSELRDFSLLEELSLSSYNSNDFIENPAHFESLKNSPIKTLKLCAVKTSALKNVLEFNSLRKLSLRDCIVNEEVNLTTLAKSTKLSLGLLESTITVLQFVDNLKLEKIRINGIVNANNLLDAIFVKSTTTIKVLKIEGVHASHYSKILKGLNLERLNCVFNCHTDEDYQNNKKTILEITSSMTHLKDVGVSVA